MWSHFRAYNRRQPTIGDMARSHRVSIVIDYHQAERQATVIEVVGMIRGCNVTILFDFGATNSFISSFVVERRGLVVAA